ncbi:aldehyde dehydrogenase (NADP(+)) [Shewanella sp. GXUN23E]|uniref:aldehyde dehydrogenase (NADP(+)) n=1 Tax=Shewanella sp. GXUN23E TaxID=3422498 RepID=UPI003D7E3D04
MLSGLSFINNQWVAGEQGSFTAINALDHSVMAPQFHNISQAQLLQACEQAWQAFLQYRQVSRADRAAFLSGIADELQAREAELVARTPLETGLPELRIKGELGRTVGQLRLFAGNLRRDDDYIAQDQPLPERTPLPRPDLKLKTIPLGPVAVFGASNFPLAFSAAGGDTASALAAGCPVVYKAHTAHPGTSEIVAQAIEAAIARCNMPAGVYQLLQSKDYDISHGLVQHPRMQAVGFTGSYAVGMALQESIRQRQQPIPFYGELGSINPQLLLPGAVSSGKQGDNGNDAALAATFVGSLNLGAGQFCTNPGLWLVSESEADAFAQAVAREVEHAAPQPMLTPAILSAYQQGCARLHRHATLLASGQGEDKRCSTQVFVTSAVEFMANKALHQEVFGPAALMVTYKDTAELEQLLAGLEGQLTASIHGSDALIAANRNLVESLSYLVGRLIFNQMPTGVEVCDAMMHGGPFPSSTDVRSTSVGSQAIARFQRPLCLQNTPSTLAE